MTTILKFFNYDLTKEVLDTGIAPEGWYETVELPTKQEKWLYYKGIGDGSTQVCASMKWYDAFNTGTTTMLSEDGLFLILSELFGNIIPENGESKTVFEY
jgi:hypothetical protein